MVLLFRLAFQAAIDTIGFAGETPIGIKRIERIASLDNEESRVIKDKKIQ